MIESKEGVTGTSDMLTSDTDALTTWDKLLMDEMGSSLVRLNPSSLGSDASTRYQS